MGQQTSSQQTEGPDNPEATWWCRLLARIIGCIGGFMCLISSLWTMIGFVSKPLCIVSGVLMLLGGLVVLIFEAPICFTYSKITEPIARFSENRTFLQKAMIYAIIAIPPFFMCIGLSSLFGCGLVFAAAVFYGLMGLGKKADRETMMRNAAQDTTKTEDPEAKLVNNEVVGTQDNVNPFSKQPR